MFPSHMIFTFASDAGQFKLAFEEAQKKNAELSGPSPQPTEEKAEEKEEESEKAAEPEEKKEDEKEAEDEKKD